MSSTTLPILAKFTVAYALFAVLLLRGDFVKIALAQAPENVLVVVNAESQDSLAVANKYVQLRDIPACNVVYLRGVTNLKDHKFGEESTLSWKFKQEILDPILTVIKRRRLEKQIDCIAYSAGFPTRVNFNNPELKTYLKQTGQKYSLVRHNPWASITSLTYFHLNAFSENPNFLRFDANRYANPQRMKLSANPFTGDDGREFDSAMKDLVDGNFISATEKFSGLEREHREQISVVYALAKCFALEGEANKSLMLLERAKEIGFAYRSVLLKDEAFLTLRSEPRFIRLVQDMEDLPEGLHPTRSFSSQSYWAKNGWANGTSDQGERYVLSSVLAVTGELQSTLKASLDRLESSVAADGTFPRGNVYFADHKDVRSKCRRGQFPYAVAELKSLGRQASIGPDIYPIDDDRVIGATLGSPKFDWADSKSSFLPGAICDNLTSAGGVLTSSQTYLSEFLDAGAAGATGTVCEPYALQAKFPTSRWHAHYARGATLAESYYQSVAGPFQLLLVGDPLCCPFGKFPEFEVRGIEEGASVTSDFVLQTKLAAASPPIKHYEIYFDGVLLSKLSAADQIAVEIDAMSDGYHELRVVGVGASVVANRASRSIAFVVNRDSHKLNLSISNLRIQLGGTTQVQVESSLGKRIAICQNLRTVATVDSREQKSIAASQIGLGKSKLYAVVLEDGRLMRSTPIEVEVVE